MKRKYITLVLIFLILIAFTFGVSYFAKRFTKTSSSDEKNGDVLYQEDKDNVKSDDIDESLNSDLGVEAFSGYKLATEDMQKNYLISDIKYEKNDNITVVNGKLKNNGNSSKIILKLEFYRDGESIGSSSIPINDLKKNEEREFEIKALNNVSSEDYKVFVEYVGE